MNQDIIIEILRHLYLYSNNFAGKTRDRGDCLVARKVIISTKKSGSLDLKKYKVDRPIVFSLSAKPSDAIVLLSNFSSGSTIYWGDDIIEENNGKLAHIGHRYPTRDTYIVRIFDSENRIVLPNEIKKLYSVGNLTDLSELCFGNRNKFHRKFAKTIDTSEVIDMSRMFAGCTNMNINVGKNWDVSKVVNMSSMFNGCRKLNKNIGFRWNTDSLINVESMFQGCRNLNHNVGQYWITSRIKNMSFMFSFCTRLNKNIGQLWNTASVNDTTYMFGECSNLDQNIGQYWNTISLTSTRSMFVRCVNLTKDIGRNWDITNLSDTKWMFYECEKIDKNNRFFVLFEI
jgi:hypothetical protein